MCQVPQSELCFLLNPRCSILNLMNNIGDIRHAVHKNSQFTEPWEGECLMTGGSLWIQYRFYNSLNCIFLCTTVKQWRWNGSGSHGGFHPMVTHTYISKGLHGMCPSTQRAHRIRINPNQKSVKSSLLCATIHANVTKIFWCMCIIKMGGFFIFHFSSIIWWGHLCTKLKSHYTIVREASLGFWIVGWTHLCSKQIWKTFKLFSTQKLHCD